MIALLLILVPLLGGLITFFIREERAARIWSLVFALVALVVAILGLTIFAAPQYLTFRAEWMPGLGSSFSIRADGMGVMLSLLTTLTFPIIFISTWSTPYSKAWNFFGLMLLSEAGLLGVFLAMDALLFYFAWELALIPVYFLCSQWGGERRIAVTFKFFIYTFLGSLLMLVAIIYIYTQTPERSFDISAFYATALPYKEQSWLFWLMFAAFAVKMPVFPLHTWQPDTYEVAPTAVTMVLSAIMVKMGVLGMLRWLLPVLPLSSYAWGDTVSTLAVIGIVYASLIAFRQNDLKRLVAYSSIAHMGLMVVAVLAETQQSVQGTMFQMFVHGINILGMWVVVEFIERKYGTRKISDLGGVAQKSPALAIAFMVIMLGNIALPLTDAFVGEFLMLSGILVSKITAYGVTFTAVAALGVVLGPVYYFRMTRKVFMGPTNELTERGSDIGSGEKLILGVIVVLILFLGIYPHPLLELVDGVSKVILKDSDVLHLLKK